MKQKRIEDYGIQIGELRKGKRNKITDVKGVKIGHTTIDTEENKTGVTVLLPCEANVFDKKLVAASYVINGFGKTAGLVQIDELGSLESMIAFTNTLNVGLVHDAVVDYTVEKCNDEGVDITSFNPIICECNDSFLNNIQNRIVSQEDVFKAIESASEDFLEGDVGAGKGMSCHQLKGGIGSASRIISLGGDDYTVGIMVLSNHGSLKDLTINGDRIGQRIDEEIKSREEKVEGSIIVILATDIPLSSRQLKRLCKRVSVGLGRTGSYISHGSGEVVVGFSTANVIEKEEKQDIVSIKLINEDKINPIFRAVAEATEEAVLNSMVTANRLVGYKGNKRETLKDFL
jgi:D-aminopeptidase